MVKLSGEQEGRKELEDLQEIQYPYDIVEGTVANNAGHNVF